MSRSARPSRHRERSPLLKLIADGQAGLCALCGGKLQWGGNPNSLARVTYDHVILRALGGGEHNNRLAAHKGCNQIKADRAPTACEMLFLTAINAHLARCFSPPASGMSASGQDPKGLEAKPASPVTPKAADAQDTPND